MKISLLSLSFLFLSFGNLLAQKELLQFVRSLPVYFEVVDEADWLVNDVQSKAGIYNKDNREVVLANGLVHRAIRILPNGATVDFKNLVSGESMLRGIKPEATITLDGIEYHVGGLEGQTEYGYLLPQWVHFMTSNSNAFKLKEIKSGDLKPRFPWKQKRYSSNQNWPPSGKIASFAYEHPSTLLNGIQVIVHYEIYDGLPLISKWIEVKNGSAQAVKLNAFKSEILAVPEAENLVDSPKQWRYPNIHVESDYSFGGMNHITANQTIHWEIDTQYTSQVNWLRETPCLLESKLPKGPEVTLKPKDTFTSYRTFELLLDATDRERQTLSLRRMYRTIAPWAGENPMFMHLTSTDPEVVHRAVDQCVDTGYEMVILSFGSGLSMEDTSAANIQKFKDLADYAHQKGIELGGYSLFSSRRISDEHDVIDVKTGKPGAAKFLHAPCLASQWGLDYLDKVKYFLKKTGFDLLEHDGPYPGDYCASTTHPGHEGHLDSQWKQWQLTAEFYQWCRAQGIYLNVPDFYYLAGSNKCAIGYREVNWSLPRAQQIILGRQNIYDGTWEKTPSMGWTFVPLTEYHGGGAEATIEPLSEHLDAYKAHMVQNYGSGVQACYRGPRLYDTDSTLHVVRNQVNHYKKYRDILNSDIIHLRRPDGRDLDGILHVNPKLKEKGLVMIYNPTSQEIIKFVKLPLYYTGLTEKALVREQEGKPQIYHLDRAYEVRVQVTIPAGGYTWLVVEGVD